MEWSGVEWPRGRCCRGWCFVGWGSTHWRPPAEDFHILDSRVEALPTASASNLKAGSLIVCSKIAVGVANMGAPPVIVVDIRQSWRRRRWWHFGGGRQSGIRSVYWRRNRSKRHETEFIWAQLGIHTATVWVSVAAMVTAMTIAVHRSTARSRTVRSSNEVIAQRKGQPDTTQKVTNHKLINVSITFIVCDSVADIRITRSLHSGLCFKISLSIISNMSSSHERS
jgi:hypothetical protein